MHSLVKHLTRVMHGSLSPSWLLGVRAKNMQHALNKYGERKPKAILKLGEQSIGADNQNYSYP